MTDLRKTFKEFIKSCHLKSLKDCKRHRFLCIILSRNFTSKEREEDILVNEIFSHRDFSERLKLEFANQTQEEHHGSNATVSIEGCAIKFFPPGSDQKTGHFFRHLSGGKQQDSAVVMDHMSTLVSHLKKKKILKKGGTILCHSDGCAGECFVFIHFISQKPSF